MGIYLPWAWQLIGIVTACKAALSGQDIYYGFFSQTFSKSPIAVLNHLFCVKISTASVVLPVKML